METTYFIVFVIACTVALGWFIARQGRAKKSAGRARLRQKAKKANADLLATPSSYVLSRNEEVWQSKRAKERDDVIVTNRFAPRSESGGQPEYDGYSRRDRSHIVVGTAYIKKEDHIDEVAARPERREGGKAS